MRELQQTVQEFVNITYQDVMQGLEVEKPGTSHPQLKMTLFSWVLATPVDEQRAIEAPPCPASLLAEDEAIWCTSPPPDMLVITLSVDQMNIGPGGDNDRRSP